MSILGDPNAQQMPQEQMPPEAAEPMPEQGAEEVEATPEEQAMVEQYVKASLKQAMGNPSIHSNMVQTMRASAKTNLSQGIAQIAVMLYDKAEQDIGLLPNEDLQEPIFESIIENLMAVAAENTLAPIKVFNEDMAVEIYTMAGRLWIDAHPDRADPEDEAYIAQAEAQGKAQPEHAPQQAPEQPQSGILGA
ncbi:MAG TPA: hypothetical protein DHU81_15200 [Hyphomonas sp.]|nr:hypothetical protein [Hyphomonas sp.]